MPPPKKNLSKSKLKHTPDYIRALIILSPRECEILNRVSKGFSAAEIASELSLSIHTIRAHIKNIKEKLSLSGSRSLILWIRENTPVSE